MFDFSLPELLIVVVLAVVLIRPADMPEIMRMAGKMIGKTKRMGKEFMAAIDDASGKDAIKQFKEQIAKEEQIIDRMIDLDGNPQDLYDVSTLEDASRIPRDDVSEKIKKRKKKG